MYISINKEDYNNIDKIEIIESDDNIILVSLNNKKFSKIHFDEYYLINIIIKDD